MSQHNKTAKHLKKLESHKNIDSPSTSTSFDSCGEAGENRETEERETLNEGPISNKTDASGFVDCVTVDNKEYFSCDVCHKKFSKRRGLTIHMTFHTKEKPFKCDFCKEAFTQQHHLERHMRIHKASFLCEVCNKTFESNDVLSIHKYLHPEQKLSNKIKSEKKEEETLDEDPLSIKMEAESVEVIIKEEARDEEGIESEEFV